MITNKIFKIGIVLFLLGFLNETHSQWNQVGNTLIPPTNDYITYGSSLTMTPDGEHLAFRATNYDGTNFTYEVNIFQFTGSSWQQKGNPILFPEGSVSSIDINSAGTIVTIGSPFYEQNGLERGALDVYEWTNGSWIKRGSTLIGETEEEKFGWDVLYDESNDRVLVLSSGFKLNNSTVGKISVFQWNGNQYAYISEILGNGGSYGEYGIALSKDGNILAVGAINDEVGGNLSAGKIYVYERQNAEYVAKGTPIPGTAQFAQFGWNVVLNANGTTVAAAGYPNDIGTVRVFDWNGSIWFQRGDALIEESSGDNFGVLSLSDNGNILAIGAYFNDGGGNNAGNVKVYQWENHWNQIGFDIEGVANDLFGTNVSLNANGSRLAVYASQTSNPLPNGYVKVFENPLLSSNLNFLESNVMLFPNPASEVINITSQFNFDVLDITIFNSYGQSLKSWSFNETSQVKLDLSFPSGVYYLSGVVNNTKAFYKIFYKY